MKNIEDKVKKIISKIMEIDLKIITKKSNLLQNLKVDSLDIIEIAMTIEEKFKIEIPDSDLEKFNTINDIVKYIHKKSKK